jgi:hypothetical protein
MSDPDDSDESDCSLTTQEMEAIQNLEPNDTPEAPESEPEPKAPTESPEPRKTEKPKRGRPKGSKNTKIETIVQKVVKIPKSKLKKQNIVYVVEEDDGSIREINKSEIKPKRNLTKKEASLLKNEEEAGRMEIEHGKQLCRTKNKKVDKRSYTRTAAQIAATERLVELNKNKRMKRLEEQRKDLKEATTQAVTEVLNGAVRDTTPVRRPVSAPVAAPVAAPVPIVAKKQAPCYMSDFV